MMIKFASWNLCLGIKNKKDYVYDTIRNEKIDICLLQEVEIKKDYPTELLSSTDYKIEIEKHKIPKFVIYPFSLFVNVKIF